MRTITQPVSIASQLSGVVSQLDSAVSTLRRSAQPSPAPAYSTIKASAVPEGGLFEWNNSLWVRCHLVQPDFGGRLAAAPQAKG